MTELFAAIAELLGSSRVEHPESRAADSVLDGSVEVKAKTLIDQQALINSSIAHISCPALALQHEHESDSQTEVKQKERAQAEKHAAELLARPLDIAIVKGHDECLVLIPSSVSETLLQNVYQSFAILVYSRVRAYATLLARHCICLSKKDEALAATCVERKLEGLYFTANAVYARDMITNFVLGEALDMSGEDLQNVVPLTLSISLDLVLPHSSGDQQVFTMAVDIPGEMKVEEDSSIKIELDTPKLLASLVEQASEIVDAIAEIASAKRMPTAASKLMPRSNSFLAMPPPKARNSFGLELLSDAAASTPPVVSPDLSGRQASNHIPILRLEDSAENEEDIEEDVTEFSVDQCASIVDNIFGEGLDDSVFIGPPPSKRARVA